MATQVELQVGLNILVGGVPVALVASVDKQADQTVYTFDGSVQSATLPLGHFLAAVARQFGVTVQLPPELNLDIELDYVVGQVTYTKPADPSKATTQLAAAGKFETVVAGKNLELLCFVAAELASGAGMSSPYVVGASIGTDLAFKDLPLVGKVSGFNDLALRQLGFTYSNVAKGTTPPVFQIPQVTSTPNPLYTRTKDPDAREAKVYSVTSSPAPAGMSLTQGGFSLTVGLVNTVTGATTANFALPLSMPASPPPPPPPPGQNPPPPPPAFASGTTSPPAGPVHWITIDKTFGPVNLKQIGLNYSGGAASFGFSAAFAMGGFSLDLEGLTITFPVSKGCTQGLSFDLQGLSMGFTQGPLSVNGAFAKTAAPPVSYYGEVAVQAANFGFQALGGYTPSTESFFLYANVQVPLGGPPFFFVTGLAAGFGVNTELILPTLQGLSTCPLLHNAPPAAGTPAQTIQSVIPALQGLFRPKSGDYWVAAGLHVTSFEMIEAFALVTVQFGVDFQVAVLGTCSMSLPVGEPLAYVEVDLLASYTQSTGLIAVMGQLSPASYLLGGFVKLTGGFAFYTWVSGPNHGNFVVSLGGYSSAYSKPDIYPVVPRIGLSFGLGPFQAKGEAYFALVPSMMMAGIDVSATWSSGGIKVWLDVGVEFMIGWAPLVYNGHAYVHLGCSVNLGLFTIKVQIGADLTIWGPEFGGRADVDLDIVSFSIGFGSPNPPAVAPLGWTGFKSALLPADTVPPPPPPPLHANRMALAASPPPPPVSNVIKAGVTKGLKQSGITGSNGVFYDWVINPNDFAVVTNSNVPANFARWAITTGFADIPNDLSKYGPDTVSTSTIPKLVLPTTKPYSATQVWNPDLSIAPMKLTGVHSTHTVTLMRHAEGDPDDQFSEPVTDVAVTPLLMPVTAAVWAPAPENHSGNEPGMVDFALTGFSITPIPRKPDHTSPVLLSALLFQDSHATGFRYTGAQVTTTYTVSGTPVGPSLTIGISGGHTASLPNSGYVLSALADPWVAGQRDAVLTDLRAHGFSGLEAVNVTTMAQSTALNDWPGVALLGSV